MKPLIKIMIGALMVVVGVYSTVTFLNELIVLAKAGVGPLLILVGAFIIWLESDEWKMQRQMEEKSGQKLQQQRFTKQQEEPEADDSEDETGATQQDVKQAVKSEEETEAHVCDECGREFDTQRGLSIHQSQKHAE